jgi:uroporphyrinogen decarboxylase
MAMVTDPGWVRDVSQTYTDIQLREFEAIMSLGLEFDGVFMWGDMAYNHSTFCSPRMYRDLIWPDHRRVADWVHDHGMKIIYHTDGNVNGVLDLYLEAGFDCLQPLEAKANMDIGALCPVYGDRLAFMGNINIMQMMDNDLERIEAEIAAKFAAGMATRGYAYHSDHSIPPQVSWETYQTIIRLIDRYGRYA